MKINKFNIGNTLSFVAIAGILLLIACDKDEAVQPTRLFRPVLKGDMEPMGNRISASWQRIKGALSYTAAISRDTFKTTDFTVEVDTNFVLFENLEWNTLYQVQVMAKASDPEFNSRISDLGAAKTDKFPTILMSPVLADIVDVAIKVRWTNTGDAVTLIKVLKADNSLLKEVEVSGAEAAAGQKVVEGLSPATTYTIQIFSGTTIRGWGSYTTKAPVAVGDQVIDLTGIEGKPSILEDTIPDVGTGSTIILKRDRQYTISTSIILNKSLTITSTLGFEPPAKLILKSNFDASGNIDALKFNDLVIATSGAAYFMNVGYAVNIGLLSFEGCKTEGVFNNSFVRLKTAGDVISKFYINNCVLDSIGVGGKYPVIYANGSSAAKIDNIEIRNSTFYSFYYFIRQDNVTTTTAIIDNCTFNNMVNAAGYFINYTTFPSILKVTNCILGKTMDAASSNGIKSTAIVDWTNTYKTTDCIFSANPITLSSSYTKEAKDLFADQQQGDFTIKDTGFSGKSSSGDPRWRP